MAGNTRVTSTNSALFPNYGNVQNGVNNCTLLFALWKMYLITTKSNSIVRNSGVNFDNNKTETTRPWVVDRRTADSLTTQSV